MSKYLNIILLLALVTNIRLYSQYQHYIVKKTTFSTGTNDEFSPVLYKEGIVYCSNQHDNSLVGYKDEQNRLFKIFYVAKKDSAGWKTPKILAKELATDFNDGPVTFNEKGNLIYYSRNNSIIGFMKSIVDTLNKLGIYAATFSDGEWTDIKPFIYNNPLYNLSTPALSPNGERIYFSSDMPGGIGGMDLYYCERRNDDWDQPVNLGPSINTDKNEAFPFASKSGKLFFASDGHQGFGGKDLYYTLELNGEWMLPVHLDSAINSTADDFGLVADSLDENGYFSTNRRRNDDIFSFSSAEMKFTGCDSLQENNYCFTFYDEKQQLTDSIPVIYRWDFGGGIIRTGKEVKHCFPGPGEYSVKLSIIDEITGNNLTELVDYKVELEDFQQAYINSDNIGIVNEPLSLNALKTNLKDLNITDYWWNFGDGFRPDGPQVSKTFSRKGEYTVRLGLLAKEDSLGKVFKTCVMKKIRIFDAYEEPALQVEREQVEIRIYLMDDLLEPHKVLIRDALKKSGEITVEFDQYGVKPASYPFLDEVARILKDNPQVRLELVVHPGEIDKPGEEMIIQEKWARELAFYLKNKDINRNAFQSKGKVLSPRAINTIVTDSSTTDGIIEFIFMKK